MFSLDNDFMLRHLLLVSLLIATTTTSDGGEPISLFDGNTLSNWDYDPEHWRVENQAMVGEIPKGQQLNHNTWIIWTPVNDKPHES